MYMFELQDPNTGAILQLSAEIEKDGHQVRMPSFIANRAAAASGRVIWLLARWSVIYSASHSGLEPTVVRFVAIAVGSAAAAGSGDRGAARAGEAERAGAQDTPRPQVV
jgi:hypothetical protein